MASNPSKVKALHYRHAVMLPKKDALLASDLQNRMNEIVNHKFPTVEDRIYYLETGDSDPCVREGANKFLI